MLDCAALISFVRSICRGQIAKLTCRVKGVALLEKFFYIMIDEFVLIKYFNHFVLRFRFLNSAIIIESFFVSFIIVLFILFFINRLLSFGVFCVCKDHINH